MRKDDVIRAEGKGAAKLHMTESEIVCSYRTARDPRRQIGILAELNAVTPRVIREVLEEAGELEPKSRRHGGGRPLSFDAATARQMFEAGLTDEQIGAKLGAKPRAIVEWRRRQGLMRPKGGSHPPQKEIATAPAAAPEQKEASAEMKKLMEETAIQEIKETPAAVTVESLFDLLRGAVDAGYGSVPVTVEGCRFAEMHLRVELMMRNGLRLGGEPVAVELQGTPETAGKE